TKPISGTKTHSTSALVQTASRSTKCATFLAAVICGQQSLRKPQFTPGLSLWCGAQLLRRYDIIRRNSAFCWGGNFSRRLGFCRRRRCSSGGISLDYFTLLDHFTFLHHGKLDGL